MPATGKKNFSKTASNENGRILPFLIADAAYLLIVYGWLVTMQPVGLSYRQAATPDEIHLLPRLIFQQMHRWFGDSIPGYLVVNFLLLYGCMVLIFFLTRLITRGPWWLGSVSAVLFMANPIKSTALLSIGGIQWLLPGLLGLAVLLLYALCRSGSMIGHKWLPFLTYLLVSVFTPSNIPLFAVIFVLEEICFKKAERSVTRHHIYIAAAGILLLFFSGQIFLPHALSLHAMFIPLLPLLNPIGFLSSTFSFFSYYTIAFYIGLAAGLTLLCFFMRRYRHPAFIFGILGAFAFRIGQGSLPIDLVTLENSSTLLIPTALAAVGAAGFFLALSEIPHWNTSVVRLSTLVCCAAMLCQIWVNLQWYRAGADIARFRTAARISAEEHPGQYLAVFPDIDYVGFVPYFLSETLRPIDRNTSALPVYSPASFSVMPPLRAEVLVYAPNLAVASITGFDEKGKPDFRPLSHDWWRQRLFRSGSRVLTREAGDHLFPLHRIPFP